MVVLDRDSPSEEEEEDKEDGSQEIFENEPMQPEAVVPSPPNIDSSGTEGETSSSSDDGSLHFFDAIAQPYVQIKTGYSQYLA